ncbi:hypothetical protein [Brachybacterium sacelli]|uniref:hypothetical protein n=1 Tax=Brachybacterium sacelli TaxID=173364 RepID=UPI00360A69D5
MVASTVVDLGRSALLRAGDHITLIPSRAPENLAAIIEQITGRPGLSADASAQARRGTALRRRRDGKMGGTL